jgi:hypothetical protein
MFDNVCMAFFTDIDQHLAVLRAVVGADIEAPALPATVVGVGDADVLRVIEETTAAIEALGSLRITASGVLAARSRREQGHSGVAAGKGHRDAVNLVQEITGSTRPEAVRQVKLGESLLDGANLLGRGEEPAEGGADAAPAAPAIEPWHAGLGRALLAGAATAAHHHAILRGLGEPPTTGDAAADADYVVAWALAAEQLVDEAAHRTAEELASAARTIRDRLDPRGAEERFDARYQARSFRLWKDADGVGNAHAKFDDEGFAFVQSVFDAALRPRRGGPRFVDADERARAEELQGDPRTNEQLQFDLFLDVFRAGVLADAKTVLGTRQAGVRVVVTANDLADGMNGVPATAHTEDDVAGIPAWLAAQRVCDSGTRTIWVDGGGEPLRLGREERTFTGPQRVVLAVRDGGCIWDTCDRPASMCEAHHIDKWSEGGHTDVDRGVLLCRFHHMELHNGGWRITRDGREPFFLHPPGGGTPAELHPRLALRYAWAGIHPPPPRFHPVT